jgi:hypothetical protein
VRIIQPFAAVSKLACARAAILILAESSVSRIQPVGFDIQNPAKASSPGTFGGILRIAGALGCGLRVGSIVPSLAKVLAATHLKQNGV